MAHLRDQDLQFLLMLLPLITRAALLTTLLYVNTQPHFNPFIKMDPLTQKGIVVVLILLFLAVGFKTFGGIFKPDPSKTKTKTATGNFATTQNSSAGADISGQGNNVYFNTYQPTPKPRSGGIIFAAAKKLKPRFLR